jgi:TRAP-type C4-dicarboxylate transport system substrate-binding protein
MKLSRLSVRGLVAASAAVLIGLASFAGPGQAQTKLRITVDTGPNHVRNIALRVFMDRLQKATKGEIAPEIFEAGQLYAARDEARAVARGDVEMSVTTNSAISAFVSDMNLLDMPLFSGRNPAQVNALVDGEVGKTLARSIETRLDVIVPGRWFLLGFASSFGAGKPIRSYDDFKGMRVRTPGGAAFSARYGALGGEGISIPFPDVPMALSQGTIDALLSTDETVRSGKLYEAGVKTGFVDRISVLYYVPLVNKAFWNKIGDANRKIFLQTWDSIIDDERTDALKRQDQAQQDNAKGGIVYTTPTPEATAAVNAKLLELLPQLVKDLKVDQALVDKTRAEIAKMK